MQVLLTVLSCAMITFVFFMQIAKLTIDIKSTKSLSLYYFRVNSSVKIFNFYNKKRIASRISVVIIIIEYSQKFPAISTMLLKSVHYFMQIPSFIIIIKEIISTSIFGNFQSKFYDGQRFNQQNCDTSFKFEAYDSLFSSEM